MYVVAYAHVTGLLTRPRCSWAFAAAAVGEAASYINTRTIVSLSEKQLVDCDTSNSGCDGGW